MVLLLLKLLMYGYLMRLFCHKSLVVYERIKLHKTQEFEEKKS